MAAVRPSPFLDPGARIAQGQLALIHLKRDLITPVVVDPQTTSTDGYAEPVVNTRFGSFPHSGLLNVPWGSQVRAANVDTGARGRKAGGGKKRKRDDQSAPATGDDDDESTANSARETTAASTGFAHILPPTPETWTVSLPHRTQVVYTPDYSYVLQRLRVRPGDTIIEAGAGSGSFTHASVRAVFNGTASEVEATNTRKRKRHGHVYSFEFHEPRAEQLRKELAEHGLDALVTVTHADVYEHGFQPSTAPAGGVAADAIFLDLPAPWLALKHLTRTLNTAPAESSTPAPPAPDADADADEAHRAAAWRSPLNPRKTVRICTFSPCIEQVQRTTAELRRLGWVNIEMVEVLHRRLDVRRERVGLQEEGLRGVNATAATVDEAVGRLREVEGRFKAFHELQKESAASSTNANTPSDAAATPANAHPNRPSWGRETKEQRLQKIREREKQRKTWKEGRLVHRTEPEIKTHTSYLCFALLPREWSEADEERAQRRWGNAGVGGAEEGEGEGEAAAESKAKVVKVEA
ncbi:uncharacterized protein K452DRAFT_319701 [Aplosporella prunicola CBS 121167]|uniref:tRNA (adenine(58)-N(1))-methyltransferase catalytic subunit TRM61 n=1 Tax=Aplosporella prunicola CBS 121167 TaxID=1176127 RepID=A0A6A6B7K2_9PEZI|nr:uncharacterized protein K452DRAFT_319701 [Aplosporella prunicola CBS 121167]KAF2140152.1 hypothetical protein K452DRAFT_319701 [Aplosporella prunicola CBS 121167]